MWENADPFLQKKHRQYIEQNEAHRLNKFANVFNRLDLDTSLRTNI